MKLDTPIKRMIKPVILILGAIISFILNYYQIGLLIILIFLIDNFYQLSIFWKKDMDEKNLIKEIDNAISDNLEANLIIPIALIDEQGNIKWNNSMMNEIKSGDNLVDSNILSIARGIDIERIRESTNETHQRLILNNKVYDVYSNKVDYKKDLFLIYFNSVDESKDKKKTNESIMLIEIDNISEALDTVEENLRPLIVAEIEQKLNSYGNRIEAMIKKYDKNKYILSVLDKYIDQEIESKFTILEEISKICKGNKLEITLSIGVGRGALTPNENYKFAVIAKELALGRGGDQVVVKNNDDIKIFGGNSKEIEKRTRVRARVVSHALKELIYESDNVFIVGHKNLDMDCFGSALALSTMVKKLGKKRSIVLGNDTFAIQPFFSKIKELEEYSDLFTTYEKAYKEITDNSLVIIVDVHNRNYVGNLDFVENAKRKVIIDHHRRSTDMVGDALLNYIEVYASSTSEMITEIVQYILDKPSVSVIEAEGLLAGIYMDTKGFSFKTGVRTFDAASFLRRMGAETTEVKKLFTDNLDEFIQIAETIKSAKIKNSTAIAVAPNNSNTVIVAKSADELLNITGILAAFVVCDINGDIYISARSVGDINVQIVLESLGGGGHLNIAGVKISDKSVDEVLVMLKDAIEKYLKVGE
ncbi:DHH family phosphoesterase [Clostridium thermobutyricum]|uniref:DHH family phosphoesterase n=1 Tax=Clostridium thermobutyricum TaxID=29372 RepID=UPI0018ABAE3B|nr:DHH family phosphoesterase [Clostridium thermobutyricum]